MADCSATGSVLDRVLGGSTQGGGTKAIASFFGHAAIVGGGAEMPEAPPRFLDNSTVMQMQPSQQQHLATTNPMMLQQHVIHTHQHPHNVMLQHQYHHPSPNRMLMQQQQQQQQQAMFAHSQYIMLQQQMMQQQQMYAEQQQHQQQQIASLNTSEPDHMKALREHVQESILSGEPLYYKSSNGGETENVAALREYLRILNEKEPTDSIIAAKRQVNQQLQEWEHRHDTSEPTLDNWHEGLVEQVTTKELSKAWREIENDDNYQREGGHATGATIDDLAAAWAQAEAEYDDDLAANLAGVYNADEESKTIHPYEFGTQITEEQRATPGRDFFQEGLKLFEQGENTLAIKALEISLQLDPDSAKAWLVLGKAHAEHDEDRKAIACLERAVETDPYSTDALLSLGVSYVNELNHTKALKSLREWITHNPKYSEISLENDLYGSGSSETELDQVQGLLITALQVDPTAPAIHEALGVVYNVSRDYEAAVTSFQTALKALPNSYSLWNKLGATLANSNQSSDALPAYHRALQLRPKYARAWLNMAISHSNLQQYDEAARCYLQTLSLNPRATHCWSYVRIALSCLERWDLMPLVTEKNLTAFQQHFDFVVYD